MITELIAITSLTIALRAITAFVLGRIAGRQCHAGYAAGHQAAIEKVNRQFDAMVEHLNIDCIKRTPTPQEGSR